MHVRTLYRQARAHGLKASHAIAAVRRYIAGPRAEYNAKLEAWKAEPDKRRYAPGGSANRPKMPVFYSPLPVCPLREAGDKPRFVADGYYTDAECCDDMLHPRVWLLPHGRFLAGYDASGWDMLRIARCVFDDAHDAWRHADSMAECDARENREYDERWQAAHDADYARSEARETIRLARAEFHTLLSEVKGERFPPAVCATLRDRLSELRREVSKAAATIRKAGEAIEDADMAGEFPA